MKTFIIAAITADGFIGRTSNHLADWTGKADKKVFVELTKEAGEMVMGSSTYATIGRPLPGRHTTVYTSSPEKFRGHDIDTTLEPPADLVARIAATGANGLAICGGASIYNLFMEAGVVDELYLTVVPVVFGQGISLFSNELNMPLELIDFRELEDGSVLLHYLVRHD